VNELERRVGDDTSHERLTSILNNIASYVPEYLRELQAEFSGFPVRIDLTNLTLVFERPDRSVPMSRTGGGANHLAYDHGASYMLYDGKQAYFLSDQKTPEKFAGKKVVVSGTVDAAKQTIYVDTIALASSKHDACAIDS
jgi:hypothetical protein